MFGFVKVSMQPSVFEFVGQVICQRVGALLLSIDGLIARIILAHHFESGPECKFVFSGEFLRVLFAGG